MAPTSTDTIFITGGSSGIGAGLAKAFHARGARVIIGGRDSTTLALVADTCPGMETQVIDVADAASVARAARSLDERHPGLNVVINNAGIQRLVDFSGPSVLSAEQIDPEIDTNLKGLIYVTAAFLPILRRQSAGRLIQVSSGLGFVPLVSAPIYSATKAAVHAFTVALREQLRGSSVQVVELIPPIVATSLHRGQARAPRRAMPLDRFVAQAMRALDTSKDELPIGLAAVLRVGGRLAPGRFLKIVNAARTDA